MRARVNVVLLDGTSLEGQGELAPLADRVAFERQFGLSAAVLSRLSDMFEDSGVLKTTADPHDLSEEWVAFLVWRLLRREHPGLLGEFTPWLEGVENIDVVTGEEEREPVPTETAAALPTN